MNAYSILHNFDQPVYTPDFQFVSMALGYKQQKLDVNRQKIQSLYDHFSNLDVSKDVHKEYIDGRLKQILDINRNYHSMDLSDDNFASVVAGNVTQLMDDIVKGAVMDTRMIRAEDEEWEKARQKGDGKYNETNHQYALTMSDRGAYQQDQELGRRYKGGARFIEYTDYNKKYLDNIDKVLKRLNLTEITTGEYIGHFRNQVTHEIISPDRLREEVMRMFDERDYRQMDIDGWGRFSKMGEDNFRGVWNNRVEQVINSYQGQAEAYRAQLSRGSLTAEQRTQLQDYINQLEKQADTYKEQKFENLKEKGVDVNKLYGELYKENYIESIVRTHAKDEITKIELDATYAKNVEFNQKLREWQTSVNFKTAEELRAARRLQLDEAKAGFKYNRETGQYEPVRGLSTGNNLIDGLLMFPNETDYTKEKVNLVKDMFDEANIAQTEINNLFRETTNAQYNLSSNDVADLISQYNAGNIKQEGGKNIITFGGGKTMKLTDQQVVQLDHAISRTIHTAPNIVEYFDQIQNVITNVNADLGRLVTAGNIGAEGDGWNKKWTGILPNFNFKIKDLGNGKYEFEKATPQESEKRYATLLRKRYAANNKNGTPLTPLESKELELYSSLAIAFDSGFSEEDRIGAYNYAKSRASLGFGNRALFPEYQTSFGTKVEGNPNTNFATTTAVAGVLGGPFGNLVSQGLRGTGAENLIGEAATTAVRASGFLGINPTETARAFNRASQARGLSTISNYESSFNNTRVATTKIETSVPSYINTSQGKDTRTGWTREISFVVGGQSEKLARQAEELSRRYVANPTKENLDNLNKIISEQDRVFKEEGVGKGQAGTQRIGGFQNKYSKLLEGARGYLQEGLEQRRELSEQSLVLAPNNQYYESYLQILQGSEYVKGAESAPIIVVKTGDDEYTIAQNIASLKRDSKAIGKSPLEGNRSIKVSSMQLEEMGILQPNMTPNYNPRYDAANGSAAQRFPVISPSFEDRKTFEKIYGENAIQRSEVTASSKSLEKQGQTEKARQLVSIYEDYISGKYKLELVPEEGQYVFKILDSKNQPVYVEATGTRELTTDVRASIKLGAKLIMENIMIEFLKEVINS